MAQLVRPGTPCILGTFPQRARHAVRRSVAGPARGSAGDPRQAASSRDVTGCRCAVEVGCALGSTWTCRPRPRARCRCGPPTWLSATSSFTLLAGSKAASLRRTRSWPSTSTYLRCSSEFDGASIVDDEQLAYDVIERQGPGGLFLADEHTLEHFRTEVVHEPDVPGAGTPDVGQVGSPSVVSVATAGWKELLDSYEDPGIDDALDAELRSFIDQRAAELDA